MRKLKLPIIPWPLRTVDTSVFHAGSAGQSGISLCVQRCTHLSALAAPLHVLTIMLGAAAGGKPAQPAGSVALAGPSLRGSFGGHVVSTGLPSGMGQDVSSVDSAGPLLWSARPHG